MLPCIIMIGLYHVFNPDQTGLVSADPVFWLESITFWLFTLSWFTKGETIFKKSTTNL
ncbi:hypothetical protein ACFL6A_03425 [bacterium]